MNASNKSTKSTANVDTLYKNKIKRRLSALGMSKWGLLKSETRALYAILHPDEYVGGVVFGHSDTGSIMLIATDRRVIYLDTKPFFKQTEDLSYDVVAGITLEWLGMRGIVILHTRLGDFRIRTVNKKAAEIFTKYIEKRCIEHREGGIKNATTI